MRSATGLYFLGAFDSQRRRDRLTRKELQDHREGWGGRGFLQGGLDPCRPSGQEQRSQVLAVLLASPTWDSKDLRPAL